MAFMRLDKLLANEGIGTRTEVKNYIRKGLVTVSGDICKSPETKVDPEQNEVICNGISVTHPEKLYYMLHKPAGCVTATEDRFCDTVMKYIPEKRKDLFPVGRLDKDTEGLLLVTNDGDLAHRLLSPSHHVDKVYYAHVRGVVTESDIEAVKDGIDIGEGIITMPAKLEIMKADEISEILLTIREGKFHQVKRMMLALGKEVIYLKRLSMGTLKLDDRLLPGEARMLTEQELKELI